VVKALRKRNIPAEAIHGDKSQNARQRVLDSFKNKEIGVLVATDIAARGIDIDQLPYVINFDLPNIPETYVHRIGRTGRAGNGIAISFCSKDEHGYWKDIQKLIKVDVKTVSDHPLSMLAALLPLAQPSLRTLTEVEVLINRENLTLKTEQKNAGINHSRLYKSKASYKQIRGFFLIFLIFNFE
jgi:superfamily II DNA/RNA helicase